MRALTGTVWFAACVAAAGCSRAPVAPAVGDPVFESELVNVDADGSFGRNTQSRDVSGRPHAAVRLQTAAHTRDGASARVVVTFEGHKDGKDVYKVTHAVTTGGVTEETTREIGYEGKRLVIAESKVCTFLLRPPSTDREPAPATPATAQK